MPNIAIDWTVPVHCRGCGHPLRAKGRRIEDHPGTILHSCKGLCDACYSKQYRDANTIPAAKFGARGPESQAMNIELCRREIARIRARRQRLGISRDGTVPA